MKEENTKREFANLNTRLEKDHVIAKEKEIVKRLVGRPKKERLNC